MMPPRTETTAGIFRVLIVSGDAAAASLLAALWARPDRSVEVCTSGREATELLGSLPVDVVVLDSALPDTATARITRQVQRCCPHSAVMACAVVSGGAASAANGCAVVAKNFLATRFGETLQVKNCHVEP